MSLTAIKLEQIFLSALESDHGITVTTNSPDMLKKKCYSVRAAARKQGDTTYDILSFRTSPTNPEAELWIIKSGDPSNASGKREP